MRRFLELPISVQHSWDSYPLVDQALASLEQGQFQQAALLTDAIFTDDRVIGCLSTRINGLFGLPLEFKWPGQDEAHGSVKPVASPGQPGDGQAQGGDAPTQHAGDQEDPQEVLDLKQEICQLAEKNWQKIIPGASGREQMRWGIMLNAGVGELIWDWGQDNLLWPSMRTWNTQFLYWRWDTRSYWLIHADGQTEIHPGDGRWVLFSPTGHNHGWLYGLIRALGKLWLDRVFAFRDWARASEKYSLGIIKGKVPANASKDDKARFSAAMTNLGNETFVILPQGAKKDDGSFDVEMMGTDSAVNWQSFKERVHQLDVSIAVCLLGQNLSTEISSGGSRAAAQVHDNVRGDFLKADDEIWATMVRTQILTPWVHYNWGDQIAAMGREVGEFVPEISHKVDPPEDMQKKAASILAISQAVQGLAGTEADIHALLDEHGIPVADQRANPESPPPGGDVNERPPAPPGVRHPRDNESGITRPSDLEPAPGPGPIQDADQAPYGYDGEGGVQGLPPRGEQVNEDERRIRMAAAKRTARGGLTAGQRKARVLVDEVTDGAVAAAAKAIEPRRKALLQIVKTSRSYDEMRARIKKLYAKASPRELRSIVENAIAASALLGRVAAKTDHEPGIAKAVRVRAE